MNWGFPPLPDNSNPAKISTRESIAYVWNRVMLYCTCKTWSKYVYTVTVLYVESLTSSYNNSKLVCENPD